MLTYKTLHISSFFGESGKSIGIYLVKFIGAFCILFFGTKAVIGLTVPGGYYSPFVANHLDYPSLLRSSLLHGTRILVGIFGFDAYLRDAYRVAFVNGRGVRLVYTCLGYGVLSFWIAFIYANSGSFFKKTTWILIGCIFIWLINVARISLVLIATNRGWDNSYTMEQHSFYNIIVYACIFLMMVLFKLSEKTKALPK